MCCCRLRKETGLTPVHLLKFVATPQGQHWAPVFKFGLYRLLNDNDVLEWTKDGVANPDLVPRLEVSVCLHKCVRVLWNVTVFVL